MSKGVTWHLSDLAWGKTLGAGKLWDKLWDEGYCQKWNFSLCELWCRFISDSRVTAYGHGKSYDSLLHVFPQKSSGHGVGKEFSYAKEGLTTLFHLSVGSVSLLMPADLWLYCCHQDEQSWIKLLIWLKNNLERKKLKFPTTSFDVLWSSPLTWGRCWERVTRMQSGSGSFGSDFLWHLLKAAESCPKNHVFCLLALKWTLKNMLSV